MAIGDDAAAAGMDVVSPLTDLVKDGADEITKSRDYIAQRTNAVTPVVKGGTGATTAADARTNLGVPAAATTPTKSGANAIDIRYASPRVTVKVDATDFALATSGDVSGLQTQINGKRGINDANFGSNHIFSPAGRATPVVTSYVSAYFNSDGRLGIDPSAARFKQDVQPRVYTLEDAAKIGQLVVTYRLRAAVEQYGDAADTLTGMIAEALVDAGFPEFVAFDTGGIILTIAYDRMVVVAFGALAEVAGRLAALEGAK